MIDQTAQAKADLASGKTQVPSWALASAPPTQQSQPVPQVNSGAILSDIQNQLRTGQIDGNAAKQLMTKYLSNAYGGGPNAQFTNFDAQNAYQAALPGAISSIFQGLGTVTSGGQYGKYDTNGNFIKSSTTSIKSNTSAGGGSTTSQTSAVVQPPTTNLQPGATGEAVKQLQDYLVSQGYMKQSDVNTGYGTYGPLTTAAVQQMQQKLGVDNSSGPGYYGPQTMAAVQKSGGSTGSQTGNTDDISLPHDDPSYKFDTLTGQPNPKYNGNPTTQTDPNAPPAPQSTGNPALDAAQNSQYQYVIGSLAQGYTINPALTGTSLAAMLPQFIKETATQMEPELLQNFQAEMAGVNNALTTNAKQYTAAQGSDIYKYQTSLANLFNTADPNDAGTAAAARAMAADENRTLDSLDASYAGQQSNTLNAAGAAFGQGVPSDFLSSTGAQTLPGLSGYGASGVQAPTVNPLRVGILGGNTVLGGSTTGGNALNYNYNPSTYTYGSIPTNFGLNFGTGLNQRFQNYQGGAAATGFGSTPGRTL